MMSIRIVLKAFILGGLAVALLFALLVIDGLVGERQGRQKAVERDIAASYAAEQQVAGPFLLVTVEDRWTESIYDREAKAQVEVEKTRRREVRHYPERMEWELALEVDERERGIFKARVYQSAGTVSGRFQLPAFEEWAGGENVDSRLVEARVVLGISDPRGLSDVPKMVLGDTKLEWKPGTGAGLPGIHAPLEVSEHPEPATAEFTLDLRVHGMGGLFLTPLASENRVAMSCPWPHPSFMGDFLPMTRTVSDQGFTAEWRVNALAGNARQALDEGNGMGGLQKLGVRLIDPITPYPLTDRALKYGFLFIGITFAAFFLFETLRQLRIHPIQYGFVGVAQALFFLLLLGLSEHIAFGAAYGIAMAATCGVLTVYIGSILGAPSRGLGFGGLLVLLYGALYGLLQSEDHALVAGSVLLFGLLAAVMLLTRKVDWYAMTASVSSKPGPALEP